MAQVNSKAIEKKIISSGVFELDERSRPIGIINLAARKSVNFTRCRRGDLQEMIAEIAREVAKNLAPPCDRDRLNEQLDDFECGLSSYLNEWGLSKCEELAHHRDKFVNKAKKIIRKSLKVPTKILRKIDTKPTHRRDGLIYRMHRLFSECLKKNGDEVTCPVTDINLHLAHILIACEVESGNPATVFTRIDKAYYRYLESYPGLKSSPQIF